MKKIRIIATSDVHGYVMPFKYSDSKECSMGMAKVSNLIKSLKDDNTLVIDNGDCIQGSPLSFYFNNNYHDEIYLMTKILNLIGYDYFNLGNHDFNYGKEVLLRHINNLKAKLITCNVEIDEQTYNYQIKEFKNGVRIAIFGIVTNHVTVWESKENLNNIKINDAFTCAKNTVEKIKNNEKVDLIVGVYHGGFEKDLVTKEATEIINGENQAFLMCQEIEGLDILITGHQHRSLAGKCFNTTISQTSANAQEIALYDIDFDNKEIAVKLIKPDVEADPNVIDIVKNVEGNLQHWLDQTLGETTIDLKISDGFDARVHKHPLVSFINQVQLDATGADLSSVALFNDATGFNKIITTRDIVSTYVYTNTMVVLETTGKLLREYLEKASEYFDIANEKIVVSKMFSEPKPQHYNYDMVDNIDYTIKVSNPIGQRIIDLKYNNKDIKDEDIFTLVTSSYRAKGSGDYTMVNEMKVVKEIDIDIVECLINYIMKHPKIMVNHKDNIKVII